MIGNYNSHGEVLNDVLKVREALIKNGFWDYATVERFVALFQQYVECLKYEFDPIKLMINLKIKKTAVRKIPNYRPESFFYYNIIGNIMMIILKENKEKVIACLHNYMQSCPELAGKSVYDIYFTMITDNTYLYNMVSVQCIMDNIVQVIL